MKSAELIVRAFVQHRKQRLVRSLFGSLLVGVAVAAGTMLKTVRSCPLTAIGDGPPGTRTITDVDIGRVWVELGHAGGPDCSATVPLTPTYLGLFVLLALAVWASR